MLKKYALWILGAAALLGAAAWQLGWLGSTPEVKYKTAKIDRGNVVASVSASGTINPVSSVSVGSQVSGQLKEVLADFNTDVRAGQVIARIDPEIFEYRVRQAQADVDSARAQMLVAQSTLAARRADVSRAEVNLTESKNDAQRKQMLFEKQFISSAERDKAASLVKTQQEDVKTAAAQLDVAKAQVTSAQSTVAQRQAGLESARADLEKTVIRSPVDGIVIKRSIEVGQTVAASLQAPELFVIAKNLRDMQVDTAIDESDIGKISEGMKATFTVDSYPGKTFEGSVTQVRKAPQTVQNVVTYTVVVGFSNGDATSNTAPVAAPAKPSTPKAAPTKPAPSTAQAAPQANAGGLRAAREKMEQELALSEAQKKQLDEIYTGMRDQFMALREMSDEERAKAGDAIRAQIRSKTAAILTAEQTPKFKALMAQQDSQRKDAGAGGVRPAAANNAAKNASSPSQRSTRPVGNTLLLPGMTANVRLITAQRDDTLRLPMAALRFKPVLDKPASDKAAPAGTTPGTSAAPGAGGGAGGALRAAREKLEQTVQPTEAQKKQLDDIYAGQRDKFAALRDMSEAERPKAMAAIRAELQGKIMAILSPEQKTKYEALLAEAATNRAGGGAVVTRATVYVLGADGKPKAVAVRTGVSDGSLTELRSTDGEPANALKEGDDVIVGTVSAAPPKTAGSGGPRSPF